MPGQLHRLLYHQTWKALTRRRIIRKGSPTRFSVTISSPPPSPDRMAPPASSSAPSDTMAALTTATDVVFVETPWTSNHANCCTQFTQMPLIWLYVQGNRTPTMPYSRRTLHEPRTLKTKTSEWLFLGHDITLFKPSTDKFYSLGRSAL